MARATLLPLFPLPDVVRDAILGQMRALACVHTGAWRTART